MGLMSGDRAWINEPFLAEALAAAHFLGWPACWISTWMFWMAQIR